MEGERVDLTSTQVDGICSKNTHGSNDGKSISKDAYTSLFPAISMFNHSEDPTCVYVVRETSSNVMMVTTRKPVQAGDELTVRYHPDEAKVRKTWGF